MQASGNTRVAGWRTGWSLSLPTAQSVFACVWPAPRKKPSRRPTKHQWASSPACSTVAGAGATISVQHDSVVVIASVLGKTDSAPRDEYAPVPALAQAAVARIVYGKYFGFQPQR